MVAALHLEQRPVLGPDHMAQTSADRYAVVERLERLTVNVTT